MLRISPGPSSALMSGIVVAQIGVIGTETGAKLSEERIFRALCKDVQPV